MGRFVKQEVVSMNRTEMLNALQSYNFAAYDMLLYLDTHPKDKKAFEMFRDLVEKTRRMKQDFENQFGPLTPYSAARFEEFNWLDSPWPWEKEGN
jgi:spore coat protein JB